MTTPAAAAGVPETRVGEEPLRIARNVSTRYHAIAVEMLLAVAVLPFNVSHLGQSAYGLWMLAGSITAYFSVLDLGYSGALVKYVAHYRARRDVRALNEILSTMFFLFSGFGVVMYGAAIVLALSLGRLFHLSPDQAHLGRMVLLVIAVNVSIGTAFSVYGGVVNGFQRYDLNNVVGVCSSILAAIANVAVLWLGYGLVELVAATTTVRVLTYAVYRANAYRVFPGMKLQAGLFRRARLREATSFSVYMLMIDWSNKLNYSVDALVIGAFMNTSAVAVFSVGQRLAETTQRLTNQLNDVLFPTIVDHDASSRLDRMQRLFIVSTRLSLATVLPLAGVLILMAPALIHAWVGPEFSGTVIVLRLLAFTVIVRIANATSATVLKASGQHQLVAFTYLAMALVNLGLSLAMVRPLGLTGVALGTVIPVCLTSLAVLFPAGCRRVRLPVWRVVVTACWPALWPAAVMTVFVLLTVPYVGPSLIAVAAEMGAAVALYGLTFVAFGLTPVERRVYLAKVLELVPRRPPLPGMAEGA